MRLLTEFFVNPVQNHIFDSWQMNAKQKYEHFQKDYFTLLKSIRRLDQEMAVHTIHYEKRSLLSASILIALEDEAFKISYIKKTTPKSLADFLTKTVSEKLEEANIEGKKLENLNMQFGFIKTDTSLSTREGVLTNLITTIDKNINQFIKKLDDTIPFESGFITVAGSGNSVLESFIQYTPFYTGYHVFLLKPHKEMSDIEKLFYCYCIRQNQYKYSFGRQANKTLKHLLVPAQMPKDFQNIKLEELNTLNPSPILNTNYSLNKQIWKPFSLKDLFKITGSKTTSLNDLMEYGKGSYPYVTTQASNNGIADFYDYYTEEGNVLTIDSAVLGYCAYQPLNFSASDHVEKLIPNFPMNKYIALFLVTILNMEQYRYNYGRKCSQTRMKQISIKLPTKNGAPDFEFMENYIKTLPYSSSLEE